ncbi:DUF503 domain-containing protein [Candidatus Zixiibacteriota bacterium]
MIGALHLRLHLPGCATLKDKRRIIRSVNQRVRQKFQVAVAEIGDQDRPAFCEIEVAAVANQRAQVHRVLTAVSRVYEQRPDVEIINLEMDV